jgi:hypothetical protein
VARTRRTAQAVLGLIGLRVWLPLGVSALVGEIVLIIEPWIDSYTFCRAGGFSPLMPPRTCSHSDTVMGDERRVLG